MNPSYLISTWCPFLLWNIIFSCRRQEMLRGAGSWMNWSVSLERSQCDKLNNQLPPMSTSLFIKGNAGVKLKIIWGKSKQIAFPVVSDWSEKNYTSFWENSLLLCNGRRSSKVFKKFFVFSFCSPKLSITKLWNHSVIIPILLSCFRKKKKMITLNVA